MQINGESFNIHFDNENNTVKLRGSLRLENINEYQKIGQFLADVHQLNIPNLCLDFKELEFLNSSGIAMLCKFVIDAKKIDKMPIKISGNENILWQKKSFQNLKLLWDKIDVDFTV